jgi:3-hydroxyisobutyryl-CoA hydrolase
MFSTPEPALGVGMDTGGSYFLPRLKQHLGLYMILTGHKLKGEDVVRSGIATHFVNSKSLGALEEALLRLTEPNQKNIENLLNSMSMQIEGTIDSRKIETNFNVFNQLF